MKIGLSSSWRLGTVFYSFWNLKYVWELELKQPFAQNLNDAFLFDILLRAHSSLHRIYLIYSKLHSIFKRPQFQALDCSSIFGVNPWTAVILTFPASAELLRAWGKSQWLLLKVSLCSLHTYSTFPSTSAVLERILRILSIQFFPQ